MQKTGHRPIILMGGGTSMVGDPSGKDTQRQMLTTDDIANNINGIKQIFTRYLDFADSGNGAIMVNNADWLTALNYIDLLRHVGTHFTINRMLSFDSVRLRLEREQPLSFLEFNYMILQSYDFMILARDYDCRLQMGGSDQWGNIVSGIELTRRLLCKDVFGLTSPLLTTASGAKMGKSASGAIWLSGEKLSSYDFWQYWRNVEDADVGKFLRLFTELPLDEISKLESLQGAEINQAKITLANQVTSLCHGQAAADEACQTAQGLFASAQKHADNMPEYMLSRAELPILLPQLLMMANMTASTSEARRHIKGGAVRINDDRIDSETTQLAEADFGDNGLKLSLGKKKHLQVKLR